MIYKLGDQTPEFRGEYFVAETATVMGSVFLGNNVNVWWGAVLRGDNNTITIGDDTNIQDGAVLHNEVDEALTIGRGVTVGHQAMLHGCEIGDNTLIGINAVVLNKVKIGKNCLIGANALITEGKEIPDGSMVMGSPGKVVRALTPEEIVSLTESAAGYVERARLYKRELKPVG